MTDLFVSKSKKRQYPADENLGTASSAETGKNAAVDERKKIKGNNIEPLIDQNPNVNPRLGVTVLHEPSDPTAAVVDIVFVHGLTGNSARTWIQQQTGTHWPVSLLSCDIPNCRILSFGYDADVVNFWSQVSQNRLGNHALNLLGGLTRLREKSDTEGRNIIFVAHSLGGLVTQDCLWTSRNHPEKHLRQVSSCTIGILFLGTPHHGADLAAWAKFGTTIAKIFKSANSDIVSVLQRGSEMLARVQDGFHGLLRMRVNEGSEIALTCFFEELPLPAVGKVVDMDSAIIPGYASYGIHANHMDMTKFDGRDNDGYESILGELRRWVKGLEPALHDIPLPISETFTGPPSSKALKSLFLVPFGRDPKFVDRIQLFKNIDEKIKSHRRISLAGIGGAGKSQIAIEYCYRYQNLHPEKHIFWVHASTRQRLEQAYRDIARRLQLPGWNDPAVNTLQLVSEWFNDDENWLMVLDNADDHDTFFAKPGSTVVPLSDYLPKNLQGLMLITTRDKRRSERLAGRHASIIVPLMTISEAHELFRSQFEPKDCWSDDDSKSLLDALEYIPLAITQAAAFLSQNNCSLAEYLAMFCANDSEIQDLLNEDLGDLRRDSDSQSSVIKTWKLSFDLIRKQKPRAAEMLSLMAVLDRQGIPKSLLKSNNTDSNVDIMTALGILQAFSLISPGDNGAGYQMHRLVQLATQKWLEIEGSRERWQEQALLTVAKLFPSGAFETWTVCETLLPQAETVIQYRKINKICLEQYSHLLQNIAYFDEQQGRYEIACTRSIAAFEMKKKIFGLEHPDTLISMANLAVTYWNQGRWDEAEKLQVQVMETSLRVLKAEHPDTLSSMANLASMYQNQERWDEAEKLQVQVLETRLRVLKAEHPDTLSSMANLASTYRNQGRWDEAEKLQVQVLETKLRVLKAEHPDTLSSMANLASTYRNQERWDEAEKLDVQVLETSLRVLKAEHPDTLTSMANLAATYQNQGRWDEAEKLEVQVLETSIKVLKAEHPDTLTSMANLAATYWNQGRWDEAEKLQVQVMETTLRVLKAEHPFTLSSMASLAATYQNQGRWDEAEKLQVQVLETRLRVLKAEHPSTLSSMAHLAATYRKQGRWDEAEKLQVQVMETRLRVLKAEHPDTLSSMANLAATYQNQGRWDEAEKLQVQVLETRLRVLKAEHPDTLTSMANLAYTYNSQSRHSEAIDLMKKVVDLRTKIIGPNHPHTIASTNRLRKWSGA
ncbi:hypothetical protein MMC22_006108 [Lobaria immixta]|nr:hypothetical protein [Lobaria immixta]